MCCVVGLNIRITRILAKQSFVPQFFLIPYNVLEGQIRYSGHAKRGYVIGMLYINCINYHISDNISQDPFCDTNNNYVRFYDRGNRAK
jgi:hypothetical protein